jgi:hypothetical protein
MLAALLVGSLQAACNSHSDNVCENIANCAYGGSSDMIEGCQKQAKTLAAEAAASGCRPLYESYYQCADEHFACQGATAEFPGCDRNLNALQVCLADGRAQNTCGLLNTALAACSAAMGAADSDGGVGPPLDSGAALTSDGDDGGGAPAIPNPCSVGGVC